MALIKSVRGFTPEFGENCFLADNAAIIGDVKMGRDCSIWFSTVLQRRCKFYPYREWSQYTRRKCAAHII